MTNTERRFGRIRLYNVVMGLFHAAQGVIVLVLANSFALPVTATYLGGPPGTPPPAPTTLFEVSVAWAVAAFLFMSALAHFTVSAPGVFPWYVKNLKLNRNYARWIEYTFSSSLMVILIAMLTGLYDAAALIAIFGANAAMILFGLLMEKYEEPGRPNWLSYIFGCLVGLAPWVGIGVYLWSPGSSAQPPAFVYWIFVLLFVLFNTFAINMVLQYKKVGPWRDYLFGESTYILLSLTAKSLLAWMIFANTLVLNT
jgi:Heliorhodopsin